MAKVYKNRIIDEKISRYLKIYSAILISGPKWCGKTSTGEFHSKSQFYLGDPTGNFSNRSIAIMDPSLILSGKYPRLIDEWQDVPVIWDAVKFKTDKMEEKGLFILTGSSTPVRKGIKHTGAGRIAKISMRTLSLYEMGFSKGYISFRDLCKKSVEKNIFEDLSLENIIDYILVGGWPTNIGKKITQCSNVAKEYIDAIFDEESFKFDGKRRNRLKFSLLLKSLARNDNSLVSNKTLVKDLNENSNGNTINEETVAEYIDILERLYLLENIEPFSQKIRSSIRVRVSQKIRFTDPSITCAILKMTKEKLLKDLNTLGILFESMCYKDLLTYAESNDFKLYHYHDYRNNEVDAICELDNGSYVAIEIKLGANQIDDAAKSLIKFKDNIIKDGKEPPSKLIVICALSNACYKRSDGVEVVSLLHLKN